MNLKAIKKVNIEDQVYNRMRDQIMSGVWVPDEKVPSENQFMEVFGISRGTVRQAVQRLSAVGFLETRKEERSYVSQLGLANYSQSIVPATFLNGDELKEAFEFRILFKCGMAEMTTENATDVQVRKLEESYKKMLQNLRNLEKYTGINFEFYCLLGECIHSTLVCQMYRITEDTLAMSIRGDTEMIGSEHGRKDHGLILKAVRNHDSRTARETMRHHIIDHPALALDVSAEAKVDSLVKHI